MIVFFDTSALLRCYFSEIQSQQIRDLWNQAHTRVGSVLLGAEILAGFARKRRENPTDAPAIATTQALFLRHWQTMDRVTLSPALFPILTRLHATHALRGADSLHLAAAVFYQQHITEPIVFACVDAALMSAAKGEGLEVSP